MNSVPSMLQDVDSPNDMDQEAVQYLRSNFTPKGRRDVLPDNVHKSFKYESGLLPAACAGVCVWHFYAPRYVSQQPKVLRF